MITTEQIMSLKPCYSEEQVRAMIPDGVRPGASLARLLALPPPDARWVLARLLFSVGKHKQWSRGAADRAKKYASYAASYASSSAAASSASSASAASAASYAAASYAAADAADAYAASYASYAAADAASSSAASSASASSSAAASYAARSAEHQLSCVLGLELLCEATRG